MRRIVHVFTVPESLGFLRGQAAFMRRRGYELVAVTSPGPALAEFGEREQVAVHAVEMPRRMAPAKDLVALGELATLLRRVRPALVHAHTPKGGLLGTLAATLAGVRARIYHMRGLPLVTAQGAQRAILAATERTSCALASRVLAVSLSLRSVALANHLCRPEKISVLAGGSGNGVDSDRFSRARVGTEVGRALRDELGIPADAPVIGFVGRLVRDKGIIELVEAFRRLSASRSDLHLVIGGPFEERDPVPEAARRALEENARIHLLGRIDDPAPVYASIDVLALPTYREGFPNVPLEAASMELPVVATLVEGCVDAVADGVTGTLVPPRDATALEHAIARYLDDPVLRERHGRAGRARVETSFRRERIWEALADVYDEMTTS